MDFDIIGIIYIAIVVFFLIIGFARGLIRTVVSLFKGILCLVPAIFLSMPLAKLVAPTKAGNFFSEIYINKFFTAEVYQQMINAENKNEVISQCIGENTRMPGFINDYLAKVVIEKKTIITIKSIWNFCPPTLVLNAPAAARHSNFLSPRFFARANKILWCR